MAVLNFERPATDNDRKAIGSKSRGWPQRLGAAMMLPFILTLIVIKPTWFEPKE